MIGREGHKYVGTNIAQVIGSTYKLDELQPKVRHCKLTGMTRVELSFLFDDSPEYAFG